MTVKVGGWWTCKIGEADGDALPHGADHPLRVAVERAYFELTGKQAEFNFSGWSAELTPSEQEYVDHCRQQKPQSSGLDYSGVAHDMGECKAGCGFCAADSTSANRVSDLVTRLRENKWPEDGWRGLMRDAAERIEALESELRIAENLCCEHCPENQLPDRTSAEREGE